MKDKPFQRLQFIVWEEYLYITYLHESFASLEKAQHYIQKNCAGNTHMYIQRRFEATERVWQAK